MRISQPQRKKSMNQKLQNAFLYLILLSRYLSKACGTLPPPGSKEREVLRGNNKSLRDYILLLNKNEEAQQE
jgi:hypothetical protein